MKDSELSKKVWEIKNRLGCNNFVIKWAIRGESKSYRAGDKFCNLCHEEVFQILNYTESESLVNSRNELYKKCRHKDRFKLINQGD